VDQFVAGEVNQMACIQRGQVTAVSLQSVVEGNKEFNREVYELARVLSI
jgi:hypothetical protein